MPQYRLDGDDVEVDRLATMIDTGVFIAAFSRSENADLRDRARDLLENPTRYSVR